jgi:hypothetical protein
MPNEVWKNPTPPTVSGSLSFCPLCGAELTSPFAAVDSSNRSHRKVACSDPTCKYVAWRQYGFGTIKDADTAVFK